VVDRADGRIGWAVVAACVRGPLGEPVCVDYRVRQVKGAVGGSLRNLDAKSAGLRNGRKTLTILEGHVEADCPGAGPFSRKGIPRYVFEAASQQKFITKARARLAHKPPVAAQKARRLLEVPERRTGRPPQRPLVEKLRILAAVEAAYEAGEALGDVAEAHHMSRSAVRDLLSWREEPRIRSSLKGPIPAGRAAG
jgi:hypothetical protein